MRFQASNDSLIHWLKNRRSVWGQEDKLNVGQVGDRWMCWTVVNDQSYFSSIRAKLSINFTDPVFLLSIQLFFCAVYWHGKLFTFLKHRKFLPCCTSCCHLSLTLLLFPPEQFSPLKWYVLFGKHWWNKTNSSALNTFVVKFESYDKTGVKAGFHSTHFT